MNGTNATGLRRPPVTLRFTTLRTIIARVTISFFLVAQFGIFLSWDTEAKPIPRLVGRLDGSSGISAGFSPDGSLVLTAGRTDAQVWVADTLKPLTQPLRSGGQLHDAAFAAGGRSVFVVGMDAVRLYDARSGKLLLHVPNPSESSVAAAISPDGANIALSVTTKSETVVRVLDSSNGKLIASLPHPGSVECLAFSSRSQLVTCQHGEPREHFYRLWNLRTRELAMPIMRTDYENFAFTGTGLTPATFSPDGMRLAIASQAWFDVYDTEVGRKLFSTEAMKADVGGSYLDSLCFVAGGKRILSTGGAGVRVWDAVSGRPVTQQFPIPLPFSRFGVDSDGTRLICGDALWDLATGTQIAILDDAINNVAALSPDGRRIITSDAERKQSCIWDAQASK